MEIKKYINYRHIKFLPPPGPGLRRSWADSLCNLEIISIADYNKRQSVKELNNLFNSINEIKYNKIIYKEYAISLSYIIKKYANIGNHHSTMYKKIIIDYLIDIKNTRFNTNY